MLAIRSMLTIAILSMFFTATAGAQELEGVKRYDNHRLVQVHLAGPEDYQRMLDLGAEPWACNPRQVGLESFRVSPAQFAALQRTGMPHEVTIENLQARIDAEQARLAMPQEGADFFADFRDYDAVNAYIDELVALRPDLVTKLTVGQTHEDRTIYGMRIAGPGAPGSKPAVLINGCQHAREWIAVMVPMYVADALVTRYETDAEIQELVDAVEVFVVPIVNPDGYVYSWGPDRYWRKNRRDNEGTTCEGVDLNRNWPVDWSGPESTSGNPCSQVYFGTGPNSEPETQVMRDFVLARPQLRLHIDFHSFGQIILQPWHYTATPHPEFSTLDSIGGAISQAMFGVNSRSWPHGNGEDLLYLASGVFPDWFTENAGTCGGGFGYTIELVGTDFVLPASEIVPTGEEGLAATLVLMEEARSFVSFSFPNGVPEQLDPAGGTTVAVNIAAACGNIVTPGSATLHYSTDGAFSSAALNDVDGGAYEAVFPAFDCPENVSFYFSVNLESGGSATSPAGAPATTYDATAFDTALITFNDDFESDLGWTVTNGGGLTDGAWERGVPAGDGTRGDPLNDFDGSGQCYLTDNVAGNSDVDGGSTTLTSPTMDASDPEAILSYARWYSNTEGGAPMADIFLVEVSDDDGTPGSWVTLETVGPDGPEVDGGWFAQSFRIADIAGIANTAQFRVRFTASDLDAGSVVEAAVDAVAVRVLVCNDEPCVGDIDGSGVVDFDDFTQLLASWGPCPGCASDLDDDDDVDFDDFTLLLAAWGACP